MINQFTETATDRLYNQIYSFLINGPYKEDYYKYINNSLNDNYHLEYSKIQVRDWHFCIFILGFISKEYHNHAAHCILREMLVKFRYRDAFIKNPLYLPSTIDKVIKHADQKGIRGSKSHLLDDPNLLVSKPMPKIQICKIHILRTCNLMSFFYLDTSTLASKNSEFSFTWSNSLSNKLEVNMTNGVLNYFDLNVFIGLLHQFYSHNSVLSQSTIDVDINSIVKVLHSSYSGSVRKRIVKSLEKMSKVIVTISKKYRTDNKYDDNGRYHYSGTLFALEYIQINSRSFHIRVHFSLPIIRMFYANDNYALINWESFIHVNNLRLRILYYHFCLIVKPSTNFYRFKVDYLTQILYSPDSIRKSNIRRRRQAVRHLLLSFNKYRSLLRDFDYELLFNDKNVIESIKIRRLKVLLV